MRTKETDWTVAGFLGMLVLLTGICFCMSEVQSYALTCVDHAEIDGKTCSEYDDGLGACNKPGKDAQCNHQYAECKCVSATRGCDCIR